MAAYLGGEDWEHGVTSPNCLAIPPEGQVGSGQYDAGVSHTASHVWASLGCHIQSHHSTIHYDMVSHLISNDKVGDICYAVNVCSVDSSRKRQMQGRHDDAVGQGS